MVDGLLQTQLGANYVDKEGGREQCMLGLHQAMLGVRGVDLGASHGIGHQLGPMGVGHGETSCILLPAVLKYNFAHGSSTVRARQKVVLDVLWGEYTVATMLREKGLEEGKADAGDVVGAVIELLGMPRTLKEVGIGRERLEELAVNSLKDPWLETNPVPLRTKEQVLEVLGMVVGDGK